MAKFITREASLSCALLICHVNSGTKIINDDSCVFRWNGEFFCTGISSTRCVITFIFRWQTSGTLFRCVRINSLVLIFSVFSLVFSLYSTSKSFPRNFEINLKFRFQRLFATKMPNNGQKKMTDGQGGHKKGQKTDNKKGQGQKKAAHKSGEKAAPALGQSNATDARNAAPRVQAASSGPSVVTAPPPAAPASSLLDPASTSTLGLSRLFMDDRSEDSRLLDSTFEEGSDDRMEVGGQSEEAPPLPQARDPVPPAAAQTRAKNYVTVAPAFYEVRMGANYDKPTPTPAADTFRDTGVQASIGDGCLLDFLNGCAAKGEDPKLHQWSDPMKGYVKVDLHPKGDPNLPPSAPPARNPDGEVPAAHPPRHRGKRSSRGRGRKRIQQAPHGSRNRRDAAGSTPKAPKGKRGGGQSGDLPNSSRSSLNSTTQGAASAAELPDPDLSAIDHSRRDPSTHSMSQRGKKKRPRSESLASTRGRGGKRGKGTPRGGRSPAVSSEAPLRSDPALRPEGVPGPSGVHIFSQMMSFMTSMADRFIPQDAQRDSGNAESVRGRRPSRGAATPKGKGRGKGRGGKR